MIYIANACITPGALWRRDEGHSLGIMIFLAIFWGRIALYTVDKYDMKMHCTCDDNDLNLKKNVKALYTSKILFSYVLYFYEPQASTEQAISLKMNRE